MDTLKDCSGLLLDTFWGKLFTGTVVTAIALKVLPLAVRRFVLEPPYCSITEYKDDIVYLFAFPRYYTRQLLNLSPFAVKLESWLRLKGIKYQLVETNQFSKSTGQIPYVLHNGVEYADTLLIIDQLTSLLDIPKEDITEEQEGVTRAFIRMVDDGLALTHFMFRYSFISDNFFGRLFRPRENKIFISIFKFFFKKGMARRSRHKPSVVGDMGKDDIRAISKYLGNKKFMFGDQINTIDCSMFGQLSQIVYLDLDFPHKDVLNTECANITPYLERIKKELWKDWDKLVNSEPFY